MILNECHQAAEIEQAECYHIIDLAVIQPLYEVHHNRAHDPTNSRSFFDNTWR